MAKGKKTGGRNFKKGQSGNPKGPATMSPEERALKRMSRIEFERIANKYLFSTKGEIRKALEDPNLLAIDLAVVSAIHEAIKGEGRMLDFLLTRLIGRVTQPIEHSGPEGGPIPVQNLSHLSDEELDLQLRQVQARLKMAVGDGT